MTNDQTITEQIRQHAIESGLSQYRLAKETGISQPTVHAFLHGGQAKSDTLDALARYFGISLRLPRKKSKNI